MVTGSSACGDACVDCGGDRLVTGWSKGRRVVAVAMQVLTAAMITGWSKWGRLKYSSA